MKKSIKNLEVREIKNGQAVKGGKVSDFKIPEKVVMEKDRDFY